MISNPPIKNYVIHHTAVSRESAPTQLNAVNRYHRDKDWGGGWKQTEPSSLGWYVGYNYFIDGNGVVTQTRAVGEETIANKGHNCDVRNRCDVISICLAGNFNEELPSDAQISSLRGLIKELEVTYPKIGFTFHRDIQTGRTCPGNLYTKDYHKKRILQEGVRKPDPTDQQKQLYITQLVALRDTIDALLRKLLA